MRTIPEEEEDEEKHRRPPSERDGLLSRSTTRTTSRSSSLSQSNDDDNDTGGDFDVQLQQQQQSSFLFSDTGRTILQLAIPAAGALLIDPLMTLADTAFVGKNSGEGPEALAGMGSAAAVLTFTFYLFNFLCTATTPLVAQERGAGNQTAAITVAGQALSFAIVLGGSLTLLLWTVQQPALSLMGTTLTGDVANQYALQFLTVRALAAPAVFTMEASTGVLRGFLDTKTPIYILVLANVINLLLDILLIVFWHLGPMGAAIATTTAEWISAGLFLAVLAGKLPTADGYLGQQQIKEVEVAAANTADAGADADTRISIVPSFSIPSLESVKPLLVASGTVFARSLVLQIFFSSAAAMAARGGQTLNDAGVVLAASTAAAASVGAHQIGIQLWLLCSFFCDSLAAASQGLVADAIGRQDPESVREISRTVFGYSLILGLALAVVLQTGASTGWIYDLFTTRESETQTALSHILPLIVLSQPLNALVFAADGVLQGASQFPFQAKAMALSGATAIGTFLVLETLGKTMVEGSDGSNLDTLVVVWTSLIVLQTMRGLTSLWKLAEERGPINLFAANIK